jgi:glycosyltransferase involved in cell wall biosynthesis
VLEHEYDPKKCIWLPMYEYLRAQDLAKYSQFGHIVAPTLLASEWLRAHNLAHRLIPWEVKAGSVRDERKSKVRILHITRHDNWRKSGTDVVAKVWPHIREWATLTIKGAGPMTSLPWRKDLPVEMEEGRTILDLRFTPAQMDMLYQRHDILLLPSRREGIGLPVLEARARGLIPVVTSGTTLEEWVLDPSWSVKSSVGRAFFDIHEREVEVEDLTSALEKIRDNIDQHLEQAGQWARDEHEASLREWEQRWTSLITTEP